ncbi:MAG: glutathione S-transferase family protein [Alcanivoracaceae bacterium]|nr:glutathione S-transferase family protein [Alcanivoracaceae bacterium]
MKLYYTPKSHFSRKVLILINAWGIDIQLIDVGNVATSSMDTFGGNPLMKVPTLVEDKLWIIDSDHIAQYLVRKYDLQDSFAVLTTDIHTLNARAILNGIMSAEVEILLARRTGIDTNLYPRFDKIIETISTGLDWLEHNVAVFATSPTYLCFHLACMWDHLSLYKTVDLNYPNLQEQVEKLSLLPYVAANTPKLDTI